MEATQLSRSDSILAGPKPERKKALILAGLLLLLLVVRVAGLAGGQWLAASGWLPVAGDALKRYDACDIERQDCLLGQSGGAAFWLAGWVRGWPACSTRVVRWQRTYWRLYRSGTMADASVLPLPSVRDYACM